MSLNPDDNEIQESGRIISQLREENNALTQQIAELSTRLARYEMGPATNASDTRSALPALSAHPIHPTNDRGGISAGRKSIPFDRRDTRQHQGRMAYLLKKLEAKHSSWNLDAVADLQAYCVATDIAGAGAEFYRNAVIAYAGESGDSIITDLDTLIAMIQS